MTDDLDDLMDEEERWWYSGFLPELQQTKKNKETKPSAKPATIKLSDDHYKLLSPRDQAVFDAMAQERKRLSKLRKHERAYNEAIKEAAQSSSLEES